MWIRPFGLLENDSVFKKGTAEKQSMVPPLSAGFRDKEIRPWDLLIWLYWIPQKAHTPQFSLYTALHKELKQITFPMAQMALVVVKCSPQN